MSTLYTNEQTGVIACERHGGMYLHTELAARPSARVWNTPLGRWRRWTAADDTEWIEAFNAPAECESCRTDRKRALLAL